MINYMRLFGFALLIATVGYFSLQYKHMTNIIKENKITIDALNQNIIDQNTAIDKLKTETTAKIHAGEEALKAAKTITVIKTAKANVIYKTLPAVPGDDCKSALILGNQQ